MWKLLDNIIDRILNYLPLPVFLGLIAILFVFWGLWIFEYRPESVPWEILLNPLFIAWVAFVILAVIVYYAVTYFRDRPKRTKPNHVGIWLVKLEGDTGDDYLRNLKGQIDQELSSDPTLKNVEVSIYPRPLKSHDEARDVGTSINAAAVVWGSVGKDLNDRTVSNLKLTTIVGPMNLRTDFQFRSDMDLAGYEMRDVTRFVTGYVFLSKGRPPEAAVHFDRILENPSSSLFELDDALQLGGIASLLAANESANSRDLLEKAKRYFTEYKNLWTEDRDPDFRAMGLLGSLWSGLGPARRRCRRCEVLTAGAPDDRFRPELQP